MDLIALRHPPVHAPGLCYGRYDPPLAPGAEGHVRRAVSATLALSDRPSDLLTSPAARCQPLAQALADALGVPAKRDTRLAELDFGAWEGRRWADIPRAESDPWAEAPETRAPPGGETFQDLARRLMEVIAGRDGLILVTHAGPIRALRILSAGLSFAEAFAEPVPHAEPLGFPSVSGDSTAYRQDGGP